MLCVHYCTTHTLSKDSHFSESSIMFVIKITELSELLPIRIVSDNTFQLQS